MVDDEEMGDKNQEPSNSMGTIIDNNGDSWLLETSINEIQSLMAYSEFPLMIVISANKQNITQHMERKRQEYQGLPCNVLE